MTVKEAKIISDIVNGVSKKEIKEKYSISEYKYSILKRKTEKPSIVEEAIQKIKENKDIKETVKDLKTELPYIPEKEIEKGLKNLKILDIKFQQVFLTALEVAESKLKQDDLTVKEWSTVAETTANMYKAIFNKDVTNISVVNNNSSQNTLVNALKNNLGV